MNAFKQWKNDNGSFTTGAASKKRGRFLKALRQVALISLMAVVCLGALVYLAPGFTGQAHAPSVGPMTALADSPVNNQIAVVGNDRNLWLVSPAGENLRPMTTDGRANRMPVWSPDGRRLAFIGATEENRSVLYVTPAAESKPTPFFDDPESPPFYLYWAPEGQAITFLTQEEGTLAMRRVGVEAPDEDRILGYGSPFYWVWSPSGDKLLMHVGGSRASSSQAHLSILANEEGARRIKLELAPGRFQAPVWSADGQYVFYSAADDEGQEAIYRMDHQTLEQELVTELDSFAYIVSSPMGNQIAYSQIEIGRLAPFGAPYLIDADGRNKRQLVNIPVGSVYWSPDGAKLALLTLARRSDGATAKAGGLAAPLPQEVLFRWWIYHVETEELEALVSFSPTFDFLQTVPYFDQYHLSLTFWSPDSRYFLVTKEDDGQSSGAVWVYDTSGEEEPRQVAEGTMAVWSWQ